VGENSCNGVMACQGIHYSRICGKLRQC
jgi:hypothetical protein